MFAEDSVGVAVLYLPVEGMMEDILELYPQLLVNAQNKGVMILSSFYLPYFIHMFVDCYSQLDWENNFVNKKREINSCMDEAVQDFALKKELIAKMPARECEQVSSTFPDALKTNSRRTVKMEERIKYMTSALGILEDIEIHLNALKGVARRSEFFKSFIRSRQSNFRTADQEVVLMNASQICPKNTGF